MKQIPNNVWKDCHNNLPPKPDVVLYAYISLLNYDTASINPVNADTRKLKTDTCMFVFDGETGKLKDAQVLADV